uniref:discoidin domain-containing protein n=1 Tax=Paractinoplanes polyasparticus TaxID=2856853 RepID=UPI001C84E406|nr:discoidin domain-containing protein [Actinoplanes polyasparticus]
MEERQRPSRADSLRLTHLPEVRSRNRPAPPPPAPAPPPPPARRRSRKSWWLVSGMAIAVPVAAGLVVAYRATTDATIPDRGVPPVAIPTEIVAGAGPAPAYSAAPRSAVAAPASRVPSSSPSVTAKPASPKITARANPSRANLALTSTVTASSAEGGAWEAGNAADGDPASRWSSGFAEPQWLRADLGSRRVVNEVTLVWEHAHAVAYRIDVSPNGTQWRTVWSTTAGKGGTVRIDTDGVAARYVRMYGTKRSNKYGFSLFEMEIR